MVAEGHITRAAERLGTTQPKLSGALSRLRKMTGDPLLVRTPTGMEPTEIGRELAAQSSAFLRRWSSVVGSDPNFDPGTSNAVFRVYSSDHIYRSLLIPTLAEMRKVAPGTAISWSMPALRAGNEALETGDVDLGIGWAGRAPADLYVSKVMERSWCGIVARDHPRISDRPTVEEYAAESHAVLTFGRPHETWIFESQIDNALSERNLTRHVAAYGQSVLMLPEVVASSDLVAMVPTEMAERAVSELVIRTFAPPIELLGGEVAMIWHPRTHNDSANKWFRNLIRKVANTLP